MMFARSLLLEFIAAAFFSWLNGDVTPFATCPREWKWCCALCRAGYDLSDEAWS